MRAMTGIAADGCEAKYCRNVWRGRDEAEHMALRIRVPTTINRQCRASEEYEIRITNQS